MRENIKNRVDLHLRRSLPQSTKWRMFFFNDPFLCLHWRSTTVLRQSSSSPEADWLECPSSHIIRLDVLGFGREEIKVQIEDGNVLEVMGEPSSSPSSAVVESKYAVWYMAEMPKKEYFPFPFYQKSWTFHWCGILGKGVGN